MLGKLVRLFLLIFLINTISGFYLTPDHSQRVYPLVKQQRSAENDNEYVWFTRDLGNDQYIGNRLKDLQQQQQQQQQNFFRSQMFNKKYPVFETE